MMQVKPYKPQKIDNMTKASELERQPLGLDVYNEAAGIKQPKNVLEPYTKFAQSAQSAVAQPNFTADPGYQAYRSMVNSQKAAGITPRTVSRDNMTVSQQASQDSVDAGMGGYMPGSKLGQGQPSAQSGFSPMSQPTEASPEPAAQTKPKNVLDPYSSAYQKMLDEANGRYGGDFNNYDSSNLYGYDLDIYNEVRNRLNSAEIAKNQYLAQQQDAERQKKVDLQNAFINSELTKKYLPLYLKENGMGGLGVSQSTLAQLQNDYANTVSGINSKTSATTRELLQKYMDEYNKSHAEMQSNISGLEGEKKEQEIQDNLEHLNHMFSQYDPGGTLTTDQLNTLQSEYEKNKNYLSLTEQEYYDLLMETWRKKILGVNANTYDDLASVSNEMKRVKGSLNFAINNAFSDTRDNSLVSQEEVRRKGESAKQALKDELNKALQSGKISQSDYNILYKEYSNQIQARIDSWYKR